MKCPMCDLEMTDLGFRDDLEIYTEGVTYSHRVDDIIAQLTVKATKTCEDCGEPGEHLIKCGCEAILCKACSDD